MDSSEDDFSRSSDSSDSDLASEYDVQSLDKSSSEDSDNVLDLDFDDFLSVQDSEGSDLESVATSEDNTAGTSQIDHLHVNVADPALEKLPCHKNKLGVAIPNNEADEKGLFDGNIYPIEFYQQGIENINIEAYKRKVYARATKTQVKNVENT